MALTERDKRYLTVDFDRASKALGQARPTNKGGTRDEANYAAAYDALVRAGLARPLRRKYRGAK